MKLIIDIPDNDYEKLKDGHIPFSILKVMQNGIPLEDIRAEIKALREHPDLPNGEYRGVWACTDIINKYIGEEESE